MKINTHELDKPFQTWAQEEGAQSMLDELSKGKLLADFTALSWALVECLENLDSLSCIMRELDSYDELIERLACLKKLLDS